MSQQVTIRSIALEGFRSYSALTQFKFNNTGLHLIKGLNGAGKTSLFSALSWCLFKVNLNNTNEAKIPTWKWLRHTGYKGTRVQVIFGVGKYKYLVARHKDFKDLTKGIDGNDSLLIFKKEKVDKTPITSADIVNDPLYKSDAQAYLNSLLGIDSKTFLNSVLFGQRMSRLMDSKDADKRELFEKLFDASFIDLLKDKAVTKANEASAALSKLQQEHAIAVSRHQSLTQQIEQAETILSEFAETRKATLVQLKGNYDATKESVNELAAAIRAEEALASNEDESPLNDLMEDADTKRDAYYTAKDELAMTARDIAAKKRDIQVYVDKEAKLTQYLAEVKTKCPTCQAPLSEVKVLAAEAQLQTDIAEVINIQRALKKNLDDLIVVETAKQHTLNKTLNAFTQASEAYLAAKQSHTPANDNKLSQLSNKHALLLQQAQQLRNQYNAEKERKAPAINVSQLNSELASLEENNPILEKSIKIKSNYLTRLGWWQKSAFNSGGLKAYIFSAMLSQLNACLSVYTQYFGISVSFGIDLTKASKPFYGKVVFDGEHEVEYQELSGGQKQKVDICIAFGLFDMVSANASSFNIIIFDECSEGLDYQAQEMLDTLLQIKSETKAVYIISHNNQLSLSGCTEIEVSGGNKGQSTIN